jgi:hypothetical protein
MAETHDRIAREPARSSPDLSGWILLALIAVAGVSLGVAIWGPKPRYIDHAAMCARHDMTYRSARGPGFCMKPDGSLYDFGQLTHLDGPIYRKD